MATGFLGVKPANNKADPRMPQKNAMMSPQTSAAPVPKLGQQAGMLPNASQGFSMAQPANSGLQQFGAGNLAEQQKGFNKGFEMPASQTGQQEGMQLGGARPPMNLDQQQQRIQGQSGRVQGQALGLAGGALGGMQQQPFSLEGLPAAPGQGDFGREKEAVSQNIMGEFDRRMAPQFAQEREGFEQTMANRGIPVGSEQYDRELKGLEQRQNDAKLSAQSQAFEMSGAEQSRLFGLGEAARDRGVQETLLQREQPLKEATGLFAIGQQERMQQGQQGLEREKMSLQQEMQRTDISAQDKQQMQQIDAENQRFKQNLSTTNQQFYDQLQQTKGIEFERLSQQQKTAIMEDDRLRQLAADKANLDRELTNVQTVLTREQMAQEMEMKRMAESGASGRASMSVGAANSRAAAAASEAAARLAEQSRQFDAEMGYQYDVLAASQPADAGNPWIPVAASVGGAVASGVAEGIFS